MAHSFTIHQGDILRTVRQQRRLTLRDVSREANIALGYLSEIETARKVPTPEIVQAVCDVLEVRYTDLLRTVADSMDLYAESVLEWSHERTHAVPGRLSGPRPR